MHPSRWRKCGARAWRWTVLAAGLVLAMLVPGPNRQLPMAAERPSEPHPHVSRCVTLPLSDGPPTLDEAAFCYAPDTPEKAITAHPPFPESAVPAPQFNITSRWPGTLGTP